MTAPRDPDGPDRPALPLSTPPNDRPVPTDADRPVPTDAERARRRRRVWTIYGAFVAVTAVLAATLTVSGPQRLLALAAVIVGAVGMVAVKPLVRRAPRRSGDAGGPSGWAVALTGPPTWIIASLIRSAGPERGGWWAVVATGLAAVALVAPLVLALQAALAIRRARTVAASPVAGVETTTAVETADEPPVSGPPNPRP